MLMILNLKATPKSVLDMKGRGGMHSQFLHQFMGTMLGSFGTSCVIFEEIITERGFKGKVRDPGGKI